MGLIEIFKSSNSNLGNFDSFSPKNQKSNHLSASTPPVGQKSSEVQLPVFIISEDSTLPNHPVQRHQMASPVTTLGSSALSDHHPRRTDHHPPPPSPSCSPHSSHPPHQNQHHLHLPSPTHPHLQPESFPSVPASPSPSIHSSECSSLSLASATSAFASAASPIVITNRRLLACWRRLERLPFIGLLFALGSVLFWSSNGLFFKLNKQIHVLETLTISSFLVCLLFLCIIVLFYDRNYVTATGTDDRTSTNGSTTGNSDCCCTSSRWTIIFGIPGERTNLAMRSILGTVSLACFYTAYSYIPLGDATTIRFTSPVFIAIFAHFMVAEPFGILQIINCCTTLAGVVLIGRPSFLFPSKTKVSIASSSGSSSAISTKNRQPPTQFPLMMNATRINQTEFNIVEYFSSPDHFMILSSAAPSLEPNRTLSLNEFGGIQPNEGSVVTSTTIARLATLPSTTNVLFGVLLALVAAITISISMIYMKKLKQTPAPLVIFWFSLSNVILGAAGMTILGEFRWPTGLVVWTLILLTTLCSAFDQLFITMALKLENTGAVAVIQALCVVLSFVFSILILSEPLYLTSALGGVFIFISVIVLGTGKMLQDVTSPQSKEGATNFLNNILNLKLFLCKLHSKKSKKSQSFDIVSQHNSMDGPSYDNNNNNSHNVDECYVSVAPSCADKTNHHHHYSSLLLQNEPCLLRIVPISSDLSSVAPSVESVTNYPTTTNESPNHHKSLNLQLSFDSQNAKMLQNLKKF